MEVGWILGVASAFVILSFYGVVGGWTLKYTILALSRVVLTLFLANQIHQVKYLVNLLAVVFSYSMAANIHVFCIGIIVET